MDTRDSFSDNLPLASKMPEFSLPGTDGEVYDNSYFEGAVARLVVFSCNHCPYVKGNEVSLVRAINKYKDKGLKTVVISSNDATRYPDDSFDNMKEKSVEMGNPYPYLYDETQEVAKSFDAACTPECYLFDANNELVYHGSISNALKDASVAKEFYLDCAIGQVINGEAVDPSFVHPMGCSIKWT